MAQKLINFEHSPTKFELDCMNTFSDSGRKPQFSVILWPPEGHNLANVVQKWINSAQSPNKCTHQVWITSAQVAADRGAPRVWRRVSLPEGGQKFWLQWQLADTAWLARASLFHTPTGSPTWDVKQSRCASGHTICRGAAKQRTDTIPRSSAKPPASKLIFASKLHARDPLHWVVCIRLLRWHGAPHQAVVIVMEGEQIAVNMWASKLRPVRVSVVNRSPSRLQGWLAAMPGSLQIFPN